MIDTGTSAGTRTGTDLLQVPPTPEPAHPVTGEWLPLTSAQQGLWFAHQVDPTNPSCTTAEVVELVGPVDHGRLEAALNRAYADHEQCRVVVRTGASGPEQQVQPVRWRDLVEVTVGSDEEAEAWMTADLAVAMDLEAGDVVRSALIRLPDGPDGPRSWWYHAAHHVVLDGYGAQQLLRAVAAAYDGTAVDEPPASLAEVVAEDARTAAGQAQDAWAERLASYAGTASMAGRTATAAPRSLRAATTLDPALHLALKQGARRLGAGWSDLFLAAVGTYVARMAGLSRVRIGVPLMNRSVAGRGSLASARTVCTAMNVLPVEVAGDGMLADALACVAAEQAWLREQPFVRHEQLSRRLQVTSGAQLFGAQVNLVPFDLHLVLGEAGGLVRNLVAGPVEDLTVCLRGTPGRRGDVRLEVEANPRLYAADELEWHLARIVHWLEQVASAAADDAVAELDLVPEAEQELVLRRFNATDHPRTVATLAERFRAGASLDPDAVAMVTGTGEHTYAELLAASERVAAGLAVEGVRPGDVVGVQLERSARLLEVVHGVVLRGAVYLPLDPDLPAERLAGVLEDARAVRVVTAGDVPDADPVPGLVTEVVDDDAPAYLLFTSGSTGRPKGVQVSHRAIDNRVAWQQDHLPLGPGDRVLHKTPISFDVSVWELFWAFQQGATLVVCPPGEHRDPQALARRLVDDRVDVLHFVPSMLRAFLSDPTARTVVRDACVRAVVTSGEALTPDLVAGCVEWLGVAPTNLYGPTEATVDVTCWDCDVTDEVVPIGRPVWNTRCYVLDASMRPVPLGAVGELWLGGVQLADGYVGRPDLTAERFLPDPFRPGERIYRTGDLAAWRVDGALRYLGRTDDQVKVRGQRVELGEIEAVVAATPGVAGVAAGTVEDVGGVRLVVWYASEDVDDVEARVRDSARRRLPEAWLPHHWVRVPAVPVGSTGKADRRRLLAEHPPEAAAAASEEAPADLDQERWCRLVARVLGAAGVGPHDDFFALGGDSLRVLGLVAAAQGEFGVEVTLADVFSEPTPAGLARLTAAGGSARLHPDVLTLRHRAHPDGADEAPAPLFLLPPAGGLGWCYTGLLPHLPGGVAVHALQAPGIESGHPEPVDDLLALVERQYATIRAVVGDAPFHVAGWSLGGMAAQGVASLARGAGHEVCSVTLLDAYPCDQWRHLPVPDESTALAGVLRLGGVEPPDGPLDRATAVDLLGAGGSAVASLPPTVLAGCVEAVVEAARVVRTSEHGVMPGDLTVVVAAAPRSEDWVDPAGWEPYVEGTVHVVALDATHGELLRPPVVDRVGEVLARHWSDVTDARSGPRTA